MTDRHVKRKEKVPILLIDCTKIYFGTLQTHEMVIRCQVKPKISDPKANPLAIYKVFVVSKRSKNSPKRETLAIYRKVLWGHVGPHSSPKAPNTVFYDTKRPKRQNNERNEHPLRKSKKVFVSTFLQRRTEKRSQRT